MTQTNSQSNAVASEPGETQQPHEFYLSILRKELASGVIDTSCRVLVVCGGNLDRVTLLAAGFCNVTISNLAPHGGHINYGPFNWEHQDAEKLGYPTDSYDLAIVHRGLHHCYNPVQAMGELCRVARRLVICFEPYDTWLTRFGAKLGYGQEYEDAAVHGNGAVAGGVANSEIPNYVYRFREREIEKFARAFFPFAKPKLRFYRNLSINEGRIDALRNPIYRHTLRVATPVIRRLTKFIPVMNNMICFVIQIPDSSCYHPWIEAKDDGIRVNRDYLVRKYGPIRDFQGL